MLNPMKGSSKKISKILGKWRDRGRFVVYSMDNKRFLVPLRYLNHPIFRVLLEMTEEEYGLTADGPLQIPCEKELIESILCLMRRSPNEEVKNASFVYCDLPRGWAAASGKRRRGAGAKSGRAQVQLSR
ncbi:hypothetical protein OROMI_030513 [Orobanche minor]